jgi:hypothetical protein
MQDGAAARTATRRLFAAVSAILLLTFFAAASTLLVYGRSAAQDATLTALPILVVTRTPTEVLFPSMTPSRTPTSDTTLIRIEAQVEANVRSAPSLDAEILVRIVPGQFFAVTGRYARWLQIRYDRSPSGVAWVFEDVVTISGGDPATIPEIGLDAVPSPNVETAAARQTADYLTATPGAPGTATAIQASATGVFVRPTEPGAAQGPVEILPTFTYPPPFVEATLPSRSASASRGGLPPIAPIMGLAALGLAGLFISSLRRGR